MEILFFFVLVYAGKHAWDQAWEAWRRSRSAYMKRADQQHPDMPAGRRAGHALRHDLGYGASQARHGFPQARHGFAAGWHQGRQAHVQAQAERERVKAEHLETRARLIPDLREYRRRQKAALEVIRRGAGPEVTRAACTHAPAPCTTPWNCPCDCPDCLEAFDRRAAGTEAGTPGPEAVPVDGRTYSWGPADGPSGWPADDAETAHRWARRMSTDGNPKVVTEYPPGGGPGRTIVTYVGGEAVYNCDLCGQPMPAGSLGIAHPACIDASEEVSSPDPSPMEGTDMPPASGDTTYTQQMSELAAIRRDAEEEVNSVRLRRMVSRLDVLASLGLDSASLSEAAAIDDALQAQQKAAQQTLDAADAAIHGLRQRHGGIKEAVDNAPVDKPAEPEFYKD